MKKYLVAYEKYIDNRWNQFIEAVDIPGFCCLLQGMINNDISDLFIQLKALRPAVKIGDEAAKTILVILSEEHDAICNEFFEKNLTNI